MKLQTIPKSYGLLALLALGLLSCAVGPIRKVRSYKTADLASYDLRRIVVMPFRNETAADSSQVSKPVTGAFLEEMRKDTPFEILELPEETAREINPGDPTRRGEYRLDGIIAAAKQYRADAIIFGTVTAYKPYYPQVLGVRAEMVSTETGSVLWSVDAYFDAKDVSVENAARIYYEDESSHYSDTEDWNVIFNAPSRFTNFVAARCVDAFWQKEKPPKRRPWY